MQYYVWIWKTFSLLESVSKERIKKQQVGKWQDYKFISSRSKKSVVMDRNSFALHCKVIGRGFCSLFQLLGGKLSQSPLC